MDAQLALRFPGILEVNAEEPYKLHSVEIQDIAGTDQRQLIQTFTVRGYKQAFKNVKVYTGDSLPDFKVFVEAHNEIMQAAEALLAKLAGMSSVPTNSGFVQTALPFK